MLARDPTDTAGSEAQPMKDEKGATATLGLGDALVVPIESYSWRLADHEASYSTGDGSDSDSDSDSGRPLTAIDLNFKSVKHEPVK